MFDMLKNKKGAEMSLNVIIIAVICLIVLVVLIVIFATQSGKFAFGTSSCEAKGGKCVSSFIDSANKVPDCSKLNEPNVFGWTPLTGATCTEKTQGCCMPIGTKE